MMYREQWTLSLVASTATTATNHHNKNKPQKNNFLPKLTPADAGLVSRLTVTRHLKETG